MLENLIAAFFVAAVYEADEERGAFNLRPVLQHHALHIVVAYHARVEAAS